MCNKFWIYFFRQNFLKVNKLLNDKGIKFQYHNVELTSLFNYIFLKIQLMSASTQRFCTYLLDKCIYVSRIIKKYPTEKSIFKERVSIFKELKLSLKRTKGPNISLFIYKISLIDIAIKYLNPHYFNCVYIYKKIT